MLTMRGGERDRPILIGSERALMSFPNSLTLGIVAGRRLGARDDRMPRGLILGAGLPSHMRRFVAAMFFALAAASAHAVSPEVSFVPWKVLNRGDVRLRGTLVLLWIPATREEIRRSPMVTSRSLAMLSTHCVGMQLVRPDDSALIEELGATAGLPVAILVDEEGEELGRVTAQRGLLSAAAAAELVQNVIDARQAAAESLLDHARKKAASGDPEAALELYRMVVESRCLCPRQARAAQRAIRKLESR